MTIGVAGGVKVYTFRALVDWDVDGEIAIGATLAETQANIVAAINGTDGVNTPHTQVIIEAFNDEEKAVITAIVPGTTGDTIATTETFTPVTDVFDAATLGTTSAGGAQGAVTVKILGVDDPYGRGASPAGDVTYTLTTGNDERVPFVLSRFTPAMFNQSGANTRRVHVDVSALTGTGILVAVSI
jgi:hypothetical protein